MQPLCKTRLTELFTLYLHFDVLLRCLNKIIFYFTCMQVKLQNVVQYVIEET